MNCLNAILSLFRRKPKKIPNHEQLVEENQVSNDSHNIKATRIAIVVGHSPTSKGAKSYSGVYEFDYNMLVARSLQNILAREDHSKITKIFFRPPGHYKTAIKQLAEQVGEWKADFSIELHFNSFRAPAYGCEVLINVDHPNANELAKYVDQFTDRLAKQYNLSQRHRYSFKDGTVGDGVKVLSYKDKGYWNLRYMQLNGVKNSILVEPMFANIKNKESQQFFGGDGVNNYARFLANELRKL